jgi:hypothetical protein
MISPSLDIAQRPQLVLEVFAEHGFARRPLGPAGIEVPDQAGDPVRGVGLLRGQVRSLRGVAVQVIELIIGICFCGWASPPA